MTRPRIISTLVAGAALTLFAVPALGATSSSTTTLKLSPGHLSVPDDTPVKLTTTLLKAGKPVAGQKVTLLRRNVGASHFSTYLTASTDANGQAVFTYTIKRDEQFEAVHPASTGYPRATSSVVRVDDRPVLTATAPTAVKKGTAAKVATTVSPSSSGQHVYLQRKSGKSWSDIASAVLSKESAASFTITPAATATYRVRIAATSTHRSGTSPTFTITVTPA